MKLSKELILTLSAILLISACTKKEASVQETKNLEVHSEEHGKHANEHSTEENINDKKVQTSISGLSYSNAVARASIPGQKVSAIYITLYNDTDNDIEFVGVNSDVAGVTEFHTMSMEGNKMYMRKMESVIVPANGKFMFRKGAEHIMLLDMNEGLDAGQDVQLQIISKNNTVVNLKVPVINFEETHTSMHDHTNHEEMNHEGDEHHHHHE